MTDFKILRLLDKMRFLFHKIGIDYAVMRQILQIKLTMDERKVPTLFNQSSKKKPDAKYGYIKSLWIYTLIGLMLIPFLAFGTQFLFQMSISYAIILFVIMTSMISDFSSVLLDLRDRHILGTKPISSRTINAAKIIHITIYLSYLTIALMTIPLIVALFKQGVLFFLITLAELVLSNILIVVFTAMLYIAVLRFFDGEKLKDMINYVQIGLTLAMMIGYQVVIRSFEFVDLSMTIEPAWWHFFLVPMWFAAPYELLLNGTVNFFTVTMSLLAIIIPFAALWLYIQLIPTFERNLQKLLATSKSKKTTTNRFKAFLLSLLCRTHEERAFYRFATLMMKKERDFKLKVYPSLGFSIVIPFIFIFNTMRDETANFATSSSYLTIYFSMLIIPTALLMLQYSTNYKGAWLFKAVPITNFTIYKKAALKAFLVQLYTPLYLMISIIFCLIYGVRVLPDLLIVFAVSCLYSAICYIASRLALPFSEPAAQTNEAQGWKALALLLPLIPFVFVHSILLKVDDLWMYVYLIMLIVSNAALWKVLFREKKANI
ncbi:hypothetical protein R6U77_13610 [Lysinibacillus louembei]|uniref:ABC transporter permease n=1 Tax=Lysinibacillus louembei TaxID=1470088 RepID=A0ABZ0RTS5_9BACI|nr:hypothetical protein [Lysinibacillus louembei]WPK10915.1 hypothetical protein R6U77_13610 [Lysinibacillus louembei]